MEYKQIFKKSDGRPKLIQSVYDENKEKEVFKYDKDKYMEEMPPSELYEPIYYDDDKKEWIGTPYEEYKRNLDKEIEEEYKREGIE